MTNPKWWDVTISREMTTKKGELNPYYATKADDIGRLLMANGAERCVVGEEVGDDGYLHYQARVVWKKGHSFEQCIMVLPGCHWSETSVRDFKYVEKEGKFWRSWEGALAPFATMELYPWQNEVIERIQHQGDRKITVLIDEYGNSGKTTMAKAITARHIGAYCPAMDESKDYMAWALAHQTAKVFVLDIPKSDSRKKNADLWSAVEQMKNGYLWDKRNHWQEAWIESPGVLVITNEEPDRSLLSHDRWDIGYMKYGISNWANTIEWGIKYEY